MKYRRIVITGVPGTGKTTLSKKIGERLGLKVLNVSVDFLESKGIRERSSSGGEILVDLDELRTVLLKEEGILESHLLCEFSLPDSVVIVLRCEPTILKKRLLGRSYTPEKIGENLECEALDYCSQMARMNYGRVFELDTSHRSSEESVEEVVSILNGFSEGDSSIDFSDYLL